MLRLLLIVISFIFMTSELDAQMKDHHYTTVSQKDSIIPYKPAAMYNGDLKELAKKLEKKYAKKKNRPTSELHFSFKALVDQKPLNDLQQIELTEGSISQFSDFILEGLKDSGKAWKPMLQGGRAVRSYIRINVQLHSDNSITITTSNDL